MSSRDLSKGRKDCPCEIEPRRLGCEARAGQEICIVQQPVGVSHRTQGGAWLRHTTGESSSSSSSFRRDCKFAVLCRISGLEVLAMDFLGNTGTALRCRLVPRCPGGQVARRPTGTALRCRLVPRWPRGPAVRRPFGMSIIANGPAR